MNIFEMMLTIAIMAILFTSSFWGSHSFFQHQKINQLKHIVKNAVFSAREQSVIEDSDVAFCLINSRRECDRDGQYGISIFSIGSGGQAIKVHREIPFSSTAKGIFHLSSFPNYRNYLRFSTRQIMSDDNGHIAFQSEDNHVHFLVKVNKLGKIEVVDRGIKE